MAVELVLLAFRATGVCKDALGNAFIRFLAPAGPNAQGRLAIGAGVTKGANFVDLIECVQAPVEMVNSLTQAVQFGLRDKQVNVKDFANSI